MNKLFKIIFISFILFFIKISVFSQEINNASSFEKAYLHTDRNVYIAGENVFFKIYLFDGLNFKPKLNSTYAYLILRNEQNTNILEIQVKIQNFIAYGSIYLPDTLHTGRYQLVLYTNCMRNAGENSFFTEEIFIANRFDNELIKIIADTDSSKHFEDDKKLTKHNNQNNPLINITPNKNNYSNNEGFRIGFEISGKSSNSESKSSEPIISTMHNSQNYPSITILPEKSCYAKREKIRIELCLSGKSAESVANLSFSVGEEPSHFNKHLSLFDYQSNSTSTSTKELKCNYFPETDGIIIQGKLSNPENGLPIGNSIVFLSSLDTIANLQIARTDLSGIFRFKVSEYYDGKELIIRTPFIPNGKIELDDKFNLKIRYKPLMQFSDSGFLAYLHNSQNFILIQKVYQSEIKKDTSITGLNTELPSQIFSPIQTIVFPADYIKLSDFAEISHEIVPLLRIRQHKNNYVANILNEKEKQFFENPPLIFLDGVPIDDINQIIKLNSEKIKKIETICSARYYGGMYFSGILAIFSYKNEINNVVWQTPTLSMKLDSPSPWSTLIKPDYATFNRNNKYKPDVRQLLDWEPNITIHSGEKKYFEFYASDIPGDYDIIVEGITTDGFPVSSKCKIKIISNLR